MSILTSSIRKQRRIAKAMANKSSLNPPAFAKSYGVAIDKGYKGEL